MTVMLPETRESIFERGDRIYMTAPVQVFTPNDSQIEELAFAQQVKKTAPNDNIVWLKGQYVEADQANLNGAQWRADELAIKSLTPMLMPVTVMHDPRTAVGTIADVALYTPEKDGVPRARIETVLALWAHRFPEAVEEAVANANAGKLMQSMECLSPWYECSACGSVFHKLPGGAEQANWCSHLKASRPTGGYLASAEEQASNASRILGDVTFTGTGLIYGSRGVQGAYTEAHLELFQDELASYHDSAHSATHTSLPVVTANGGTSTMGLVQIEESELKVLRDERDGAKTELAAEKAARAEAETKAEQAEQAKLAAETAKAEAETEKTRLEEEARAATLKDERLGKLGAGFMGKLGEIAKSRLNEQAKSMSDEDWDGRLKELEELAGVQRDAAATGQPTPPSPAPGEQPNNGGAPAFEDAEIASFVSGSAPGGTPTGSETVVGAQRTAVVGQLAAGFKKKS